HLARDHVVLEGSDDTSDDRRGQKGGFATSLDLVVAYQESADVARNRREDRLSPPLMVTVVAHDEARPLFGAFFVREDKLDQDDVAATKACHKRRPLGCSKGPPIRGP